ncbi:hypothetical protein AV530_019472 [Patagioenas fasciata monilis]|uniref:Uncharacterized protein n=1 Tax=Patagioenas fasciata monilis TaxID=372326 RepID=A0A1V4JE08_PATFA|nr:hypothetical protein AV530_019472 [Patagioenas fasciata monilis]
MQKSSAPGLHLDSPSSHPLGSSFQRLLPCSEGSCHPRGDKSMSPSLLPGTLHPHSQSMWDRDEAVGFKSPERAFKWEIMTVTC